MLDQRTKLSMFVFWIRKRLEEFAKVSFTLRTIWDNMVETSKFISILLPQVISELVLMEWQRNWVITLLSDIRLWQINKILLSQLCLSTCFHHAFQVIIRYIICAFVCALWMPHFWFIHHNINAWVAATKNGNGLKYFLKNNSLFSISYLFRIYPAYLLPYFLMSFLYSLMFFFHINYNLN